ncbi:MAG: RloB family protein [Deltaproteobacteria bacterium]|nr:RloB family protein [Deltaproteobacteria bacterium]
MEGYKTEKQYFEIIKHFNNDVYLNYLCNMTHSGSKSVLKRIINEINNADLSKEDEFWVVVDRDGWLEKHLNDLYNLSAQ